MKNSVRIKAKIVNRLKINHQFGIGDLVTSDFETEEIATYSRFSETYLGSLSGDGPTFRKHEISLILDIIETPDSFYSSKFCKILLKNGNLGWVPSRWLKKV